MSKKFLNTCLACNHVSERATWVVTVGKGLMFMKERYSVGPEFGPNPEHFDLDVIDAKALAEKYKITEEQAEEAILSGEASCPKCGDLNYVAFNEELDRHLL